MGIRSGARIRLLERGSVKKGTVVPLVTGMPTREDLRSSFKKETPLSYRQLTRFYDNPHDIHPMALFLKSRGLGDRTDVDRNKYIDKCLSNFLDINGSLSGDGDFCFYDKIWLDDDMSSRPEFMEYSLMVTRVKKNLHRIELYARGGANITDGGMINSYFPKDGVVHGDNRDGEALIANFLALLTGAEGRTRVTDKYESRENDYNKKFVKPFSNRK